VNGIPTAQLPPPDAGLGVFSTALVVEGHIVERSGHLERLARSVRSLYGVDIPAQTGAEMNERARDVQLARLRTSLVPEQGQMRIEITVTPISREIVLPGWDRALRLRSVTVERWNGAHKWNDRRLLAALDDRSAPDAALLVDGAGNALETTRATLFIATGQAEIVTPSLHQQILPGVTRSTVIAIARDSGIRVDERPVGLGEVASATEAFATGAVRGIEPVRGVDDMDVPGPGPVGALLADRLRERWFA
jgi:branched-subunit amino acid aminotransferase/4-amino-4-deoxychorismate lyase